jgi:hypothetical protein
VVITVATDQVDAYNFKTGKKLFTAGKFSAFFRSYAFQDRWPIPDDGQDLFPSFFNPQTSPENFSRPSGSLLSNIMLHRLEGYSTAEADLLDAYETEPERDIRKVWWIDPQTSRKGEFELKGKRHDVCLPLRIVFGVEGKTIWGAPITTQ